MTEDLGVGVIDLQAAEQSHECLLLGWSPRIVGIAVGVEASFVADTYRVGIIATGMGSCHLLGTAPVGMPVLRNVKPITRASEVNPES